MTRTSVESSNLHSVGFNPATNTLEIEFNSGGVYQYFGVSEEMYDALMNASSKGRFFLRHIKGVFRYKRVFN